MGGKGEKESVMAPRPLANITQYLVVPFIVLRNLGKVEREDNQSGFGMLGLECCWDTIGDIS